MALVWTLLAHAAARCLNRYIVSTATILLIVTSIQGAVVETTTLPPPLTNGPALAPSAKFLFVVETSAAMKHFEHDGRQVLFDLVYSGISNQMHTADTFGIWTFGEHVSAGIYPMQVWSGEKSMAQASQIGVFLKNERYRGKPRADLAIAKALTVVKAVKDVTVVLIMSGESSLGDSELEVKLRETYHRKSDLARQQKLPVVLTFCSTGGEIAMAAVTLAGEHIQLREDLLAKARQPIKKPEPVPMVAQAPAPVTNHVRAQSIIMIGQPKPAPSVIAAANLSPAGNNGSESNNLASSAPSATTMRPKVEETRDTNDMAVQSSATTPVGIAQVISSERKPLMSAALTEPAKEIKTVHPGHVVQSQAPATPEAAKSGEHSTTKLTDLLSRPLKLAA
ncbi:MAG: hypothetical protein JWM16_2500, partial [Verrucomicrobiales bacterium]|nr:hypothetical protein [Verrucomicrobiales bacterium]